MDRLHGHNIGYMDILQYIRDSSGRCSASNSVAEAFKCFLRNMPAHPPRRSVFLPTAGYERVAFRLCDCADPPRGLRRPRDDDVGFYQEKPRPPTLGEQIARQLQSGVEGGEPDLGRLVWRSIERRSCSGVVVLFYILFQFRWREFLSWRKKHRHTAV